MTIEEIIKEIANLSTIEVFKIAFYDDFILLKRLAKFIFSLIGLCVISIIVDYFKNKRQR